MVNSDHPVRAVRSRRRPRRLVGAAVVGLLVLAAAACDPPPPDPATVLTLPLRTEGSQIVDADGDEVVLQGVSWFGFETDTHVVHGLWARDYKEMLGQIADEGYNVIRLPWSVAGIRSTSISSVNTSLGANAELAGATSLEAMDLVIEAAEDEGLMVLLDNHRLNDASIPELWYGDGYTEQDWLDSWVSLAQRYADQPNVIGADLKNEPHGARHLGHGEPGHRLAPGRRAGRQRGARRGPRLADRGRGHRRQRGRPAAPRALVGREPGGRPHLAGAPRRRGPAGVLAPRVRPRRQRPGLVRRPERRGGAARPLGEGLRLPRRGGHRARPGGGVRGREVGTDTVEGRWQNQLVDFLAERGYSWTYWSWNPNSSDTGGILSDDWRTVHADKQAMLDRALIDQPGFTAAPTPTTTTAPGPTSTTAPPTTSTTTTTPPTPTGGVTVSYVVDSQWATGYCAQLSATNGTGAPVTSLGLRFTLSGATLTSTWSGTATVAGSVVTVTLPEWARGLDPGQTESSFGFCAARSGTGGLPTSLTALT